MIREAMEKKNVVVKAGQYPHRGGLRQMRRAQPRAGRQGRDPGEIRLQELRAQAGNAVRRLVLVIARSEATKQPCLGRRYGLLRLARNDDVKHCATKQPDGQISKSLSSPSEKNIPLNPSGKSALRPARLTRQEGRSRSSRTRGGMRWTRWLRLTSVAFADGEVVWSWRPDAGAKFRESKLHRIDGGKKARSPGRAQVSRKTTAQGKPDCLR